MNWTARGGAYVLLIRLDDPLDLPQRQFDHPLGPGLYSYCGSAKGPGGLGARVGRHLRAKKNKHWHVDYLSDAGEIIDVAAIVDGSECDFVQSLLQIDGADVALAGFGSSDCLDCDAHLVGVPVGFSFRQIGLSSAMSQFERYVSR